MKVQARCTRRDCRATVSSKTAVRCPECRGDLSYFVRFSGVDGRRQSRQFDNRKTAEVWVASRTVRIADGTFIDPSLGRVTLADYFGGWIAEVRERSEAAWDAGERGVLGRRTVEKYEGCFRLHVAPYLGARSIASLTPLDIEDMRDAARSPWQADEAVKLVRLVLNRAVRSHLLAANVASHVKLNEPDRKTPVRVLEPDEVERIVKAIEPRYRALVRFLYVGAVRWSEAVGLQRGDVDVKRRRVAIRRTLNQTRTGAGSFFEGPTKTGKARTVAIDDETGSALAAHLLAYPPKRGEFGSLVFTGPKGAALRSRVFAKAWARALDAAGLEPGIQVAWLRHSGLTTMLRATGNPKLVANHAGHVDSRMVDRIYVQLTDDAAQDAMDQVAAWKRARSG